MLTIDPGARATAGNTDGRVVLHAERGQIYALNGTGSLIWDGIATGKSVAEIAGELTALFDVPPTQAEADVQAFIASLVARGLAHRASTNAGAP